MHAPYRPKFSEKIKQILRRDVIASPSQPENPRAYEAHVEKDFVESRDI